MQQLYISSAPQPAGGRAVPRDVQGVREQDGRPTQGKDRQHIPGQGVSPCVPYKPSFTMRWKLAEPNCGFGIHFDCTYNQIWAPNILLGNSIDSSLLVCSRQATDLLTGVKAVNKTDVVTLLSTFGVCNGVVGDETHKMSIIRTPWRCCRRSGYAMVCATYEPTHSTLEKLVVLLVLRV
jgi:hypothetical protein